MQHTNLSTTAADNASARLMAAMQAFMAADFVDDIAFAAAHERSSPVRATTSANQNAQHHTPARRAA